MCVFDSDLFIVAVYFRFLFFLPASHFLHRSLHAIFINIPYKSVIESGVFV